MEQIVCCNKLSMTKMAVSPYTNAIAIGPLPQPLSEGEGSELYGIRKYWYAKHYNCTQIAIRPHPRPLSKGEGSSYTGVNHGT